MKFNIPVPLIILAYILYWPVGIVLTILRSVSSQKSPDGELAKNTAANRRTESAAYQEAPAAKTKRKMPFSVKMLFGAGTAAGILAVLTVLKGLSAGSMILFAETGIPLLAVCAVCLLTAKFLQKRHEQLNRIRTIIGNRSSLNLSKLAQACDVSLKRVRADVQKLIDSGEFGEQAYIDLGANNFMRTSYVEPDEPEAFDYRTVYSSLFKDDKKYSDKNVSETVNDAQEKTESDDFGRIIREIRRLNDDIKDVAVSYRIEKIEEHTKNIFDYVTDHPEALPQIRTFMNYYLPTTLKLLESYSRIERVGVAGENMKKSKDNIENILDLLVVGFEQQVDQLFKNESIDISSDISVLETMMQKDGLSGKTDFDLAAMAQQYKDEISDDLSSGGAAAQKMPE